MRAIFKAYSTNTANIIKNWIFTDKKTKFYIALPPKLE